MIPLRLQLRNFMCYGDSVPALELEGVQLACLSGDNGHGKSALLEGMTWALWGKARAKSDDELIQLGRTEMEVEFDFELNGDRYRVIRKRAIKSTGKRVTSTPTLDFQVLSEAGYRSLSGNSIGETQRKINETLRMEYETFINSSFILQNRVDEFTVKPPAERKRVLADILGLGVYDELEDRAREMAKQRELERRDLAAALKTIDDDLARRPEYERQLNEVQAVVEETESQISVADTNLRLLRERMKELDLKAVQLDEMQKQLHKIEKELQRIDDNIEEQQKQIASFQSLLARKAEIGGAMVRLEAVRTEVEVLTSKLGHLLKLNEQKNKCEKDIQAAAEALLREREGLRSRVAEINKVAQQVSRWRTEQARETERLSPLLGVEADREAERSRLQSMRSQIDLLKALNRQRREDMNSLKERLDALGKAGAQCPTCETEIGEEGRRTLVAKLQDQGTQLGQEYREDEKKIKKLEEGSVVAQKEIERLDEVLKTKTELERKLAMLEKSLADSEAARAKVEELAPQLENVERQIAAGEFAVEARVELASVVQQIGQLGYDQAHHQDLRKEMSELGRYSELQEALKSAEASVLACGERLDGLRESRERGEVTLSANQEMVDALSREMAGRADVLKSTAQAESLLESLQYKGRESRERLGRVQQMLGHCRYLEKQREEKMSAQVRASEEKAIYDELTAAFGKNGIQAMIIDGAIPEIEREANALLAKMTDNRMNVIFETQREAKTTGNVIETLDIRIADELGQRAYEMYSGGEAFRANFAIRIALSKLLAHRAGARLQTLIIDEGFGTQDAQGRERLVECINSITDDFEKILVITHIQELKDAFPVRIDIIKTAEGSQILVN